MNQAQKIKEFYNRYFFSEGQASEAHIIIGFEVNGEKVVIPGIKVHPATTIDSIFRAYHSFLSYNNKPVIEEISNQAEDTRTILDFEQIEYNNHVYLIEQIGEEEYVVRNKESGKIISAKSPIFKTVVKKFKVN